VVVVDVVVVVVVVKTVKFPPGSDARLLLESLT
jgi:hypothetical protein